MTERIIRIPGGSVSPPPGMKALWAKRQLRVTQNKTKQNKNLTNFHIVLLYD
jgi:hypothetical protein